MEIVAFLILAIQTVIVILQAKNTKTLGEITMQQEEFDQKVSNLTAKVDALDAKSDAEASQVADLAQGYKDEIARLQAEHADLDLSGLDALNGKLDEAATRIGGIVPDAPETPEAENSAATEETTSESPVE